MSPDTSGSYVRERPTDRLHTPDPAKPYAHYISVMNETLRRRVRGIGVQPGQRVLDFGCAEKPYATWFDPAVEVIGADLPDNPDADIEVGPDGGVPLEDASVDLVLSTQVLEHVLDPGAYLLECHRLLRPGGHLLLSTHGIFHFHPDPVDYWRWTCEGLQKVVADAGLTTTEFEGVFGLRALGLQTTFDAYWPAIPRRLRPLACRIAHAIVSRIDHREPTATKAHNASVFVLTARRPD